MTASHAAPVRVLVLLKGLGRGGAERLAVNGLRYVDPSLTQVEVAYVMAAKDALVGQVRDQDIPVHCLGTARGSGGWGWPRALRKLVHSGRFDVVHTHMPFPAAVARSLFPARPPAFVHTEHNVWQRYKPVTRVANALTFRRNSVVFAVSQAVEQSIWPRLRAPDGKRPSVEVLLHGVDQAAIQRGPGAGSHARALLGLEDLGPFIGHVGNFTPKKDQRSLLTAFSLLLPDHPGLTLVMVGLGPLEARLRSHAHELGVASRVQWAGSRDDVLEILPAFDVFALSSLHEGLPIALLEAMATGVPCVATRAGGIVELVTDGVDGLVVPPGKPERLAAAMARVLRDTALASSLSAAGASRAASLDLRAAVERMGQVYREVAHRPVAPTAANEEPAGTS